MNEEEVRSWLFIVMTAIGLLLGTWKYLASQFSALRKDFHQSLTELTIELIQKNDAIRVELLSRITRADIDAERASDDVSKMRLEMAKDYSPKHDLESALQRALLPMQQQIARLETWIERFLSQRTG